MPLCNDMTPSATLAGKKGLVVGIANDQGIAHGCARSCTAWGLRCHCIMG
jgi:enoyl-[acyl-carrier-protein] reductase (NADH)